MRKLILSFILLLALCSISFAQVPFPGPGLVHAGGVTYITSENFEGTGSQLTWTLDSDPATWNVDYTTVHLEGAQSCYTTEKRYTTFTSTAELYAAFIFQIPTGGGNTIIFGLRNATGNQAWLSLGWGSTTWTKSTLTYNGGDSSDYQEDIFTVTPATPTYCKIYYKKVGAGTSLYKMWLSLNGSAWTLISNITNAADNVNLAGMYVNGTSYATIYDDIRVSATDISY